MSKKYICVEDYIERHSAYPLDTRTTLKRVFTSLRETEPDDVIPTSFVREWFKQRYNVNYCPLVEDWKEACKENDQESNHDC